MMSSVLVVEPDESVRATVKAAVSQASRDATFTEVSDVNAAKNWLQSGRFGWVICDFDVIGGPAGEGLAQLRSLAPSANFILLLSSEHSDRINEMVGTGVAACLIKSTTDESFRTALTNIISAKSTAGVAHVAPSGFKPTKTFKDYITIGRAVAFGGIVVLISLGQYKDGKLFYDILDAAFGLRQHVWNELTKDENLSDITDKVIARSFSKIDSSYLAEFKIRPNFLVGEDETISVVRRNLGKSNYTMQFFARQGQRVCVAIHRGFKKTFGSFRVEIDENFWLEFEESGTMSPRDVTALVEYKREYQRDGLHYLVIKPSVSADKKFADRAYVNVSAWVLLLKVGEAGQDKDCFVQPSNGN